METASSNAAPLAIRLVDFTTPARCVCIMARLIPWVIAKSSALTTSCFIASGVKPSGRVEPYTRQIAQGADGIAQKNHRARLGKIAELDRHLAHLKVEAACDVKQFGVEGKALQPLPTKYDVRRRAPESLESRLAVPH